MLKYNKINFTGAQGTGKTTVLNALKQEPEFADFKFYTEVVRKLAAKGLKINKEGDSKTQKVLFDAYNDILSSILKEQAVSDRCIVDVAAYTAYLFDHADATSDDYNNLSQEDFRERKEITRRKYELPLLVYFPIEFDIVADGLRSTDKEFQKEIDQKIHQFLKNYNIPHIKVSGTVEQRVSQIKRAMGLIEE